MSRVKSVFMQPLHVLMRVEMGLFCDTYVWVFFFFCYSTQHGPGHKSRDGRYYRSVVMLWSLPFPHSIEL